MNTVDPYDLLASVFATIGKAVAYDVNLLYSFFSGNLSSLKVIAAILIPLFFLGFVCSAYKGMEELRKLRSLRLGDFLGLNKEEKIRSLKAWQTIEDRVKSSEEKQFKLAIIEADHLFFDLLFRMGYKGKTFEERFRWLLPNKISNAKEVAETHQMAEDFLKKPELNITSDGAIKLLSVYKKAFIELGVLDPNGSIEQA